MTTNFRPDEDQERVFNRVFETAEIAKFTKKQIDDYEESLKVYRDWKNTIDTAELKGRTKGLEEGRKAGLEEGRKEGLEEGRKAGLEEGAFLAKKKMALQMINNGATKEQICQMTGWSLDELTSLLDK